jgi:hypothetical protein
LSSSRRRASRRRWHAIAARSSRARVS